MILRGQSSIWCKLFQKFKFWSKFRKFWKILNFEFFSGEAPALRVIWAETRLTVHRSLPYGNEQWTAILVPARITRRVETSPSINFWNFNIVRNFRNFNQNLNFWKKLASDRTFSLHYHFSMWLAQSKASIYCLKLFLKFLRHLSMILLCKTIFSWSCACACTVPL